MDQQNRKNLDALTEATARALRMANYWTCRDFVPPEIAMHIRHAESLLRSACVRLEAAVKVADERQAAAAPAREKP